MKVTIKKKTSVRKSPSKMNLTEPILKNFPVLHSPIKEGKIFSPTIDKTQPKEHVPKPPHTSHTPHKTPTPIKPQKEKTPKNPPKKVKTPEKVRKEKTPEKVQKVKTPEKPRKKEKPEKPRKEKTPQKEKTPKKKEKTPKKKEKTPTPKKEKTPKKEYNEGTLNQLTGKELKQILSEQGKPQYGTKAMMVQRILGNKVTTQAKPTGQPLPLDPKKMTVVQLRAELKKQNLPVNGNKAELIARLEKINKGEKITPKKPGRKHAEKTPKKRGRKPKVANNADIVGKKDLNRKDYENMTVLQLKALLKEKGGKISGNKTQLIDRLLSL